MQAWQLTHRSSSSEIMVVWHGESFVMEASAQDAEVHLMRLASFTILQFCNFSINPIPCRTGGQ